MGKWCLHASSFIFDRIIIKVAGNQDRHKSLDEFNFGPLVSMAHLYVFWNEIWPWHIGLRWAIVALWATCFKEFGASKKCSNNDILGLKVNGETVSDESVLAEYFNEYFINVASKLKEPIEQTDFSTSES